MKFSFPHTRNEKFTFLGTFFAINNASRVDCSNFERGQERLYNMFFFFNFLANTKRQKRKELRGLRIHTCLYFAQLICNYYTGRTRYMAFPSCGRGVRILKWICHAKLVAHMERNGTRGIRIDIVNNYYDDEKIEIFVNY